MLEALTIILGAIVIVEAGIIVSLWNRLNDIEDKDDEKWYEG